MLCPSKFIHQFNAKHSMRSISQRTRTQVFATYLCFKIPSSPRFFSPTSLKFLPPSLCCGAIPCWFSQSLASPSNKIGAADAPSSSLMRLWACSSALFGVAIFDLILSRLRLLYADARCSSFRGFGGHDGTKGLGESLGRSLRPPIRTE